MIIILIGPPGAGKGTQARQIVDKYNVIHLATGDMFRERIDLGDELGVKIKDIVESGNLVSDKLTIKMIEERIQKSDCKDGFILDGFPRTVEQAEGLEKMLKKLNLKLDIVLQIEAEDATLIERISGRFSCSGCDEGYHDSFKSPVITCQCDNCGKKDIFTRRADDAPEKVQIRLGVYHKQTAPILPFYDKKDILIVVDGMQSMEDVTKNIFEILTSLNNKSGSSEDNNKGTDLSNRKYIGIKK